MASLSTSAIIVIVVLVSGLGVAILWSFSGYYRSATSMDEARVQVSHEQALYMRQVRLRTHQSAFAESVFGGNDGATTTRTSQVWSNTNGATGTTPNTPAAAAVAGNPPRRMSSYGLSTQQFSSPDKDGGSRVNYSAYDDQTGYYEQQQQRQQQSPYGGHAYYEYEYGFEQQSALPQQSDDKGEPIPPHQQV